MYAELPEISVGDVESLSWVCNTYAEKQMSQITPHSMDTVNKKLLTLTVTKDDVQHFTDASSWYSSKEPGISNGEPLAWLGVPLHLGSLLCLQRMLIPKSTASSSDLSFSTASTIFPASLYTLSVLHWPK